MKVVSSRVLIGLLSLIFLALSIQTSQNEIVGKTYYISPGGSNDGFGTLLEPWGTIQYAVEQAQPGDTVIVRGGTYTESVALNVSGQECLPIALTAYRDETVTINGELEPAIHARWTGIDYWIIDGLVLESTADYVLELSVWNGYSSNHMVIRSNLMRGPVLVSGSYNVFEGNEVDGNDHPVNESGVNEEQDVSHHNVYRNNVIHGFSVRGIWSMRRTHDSVFENNHIYGGVGPGNPTPMAIDLDGYGNLVWQHVVRDNYIEGWETGIEIENGYAITVENNTIKNAWAGIVAINYGGTVGPGPIFCGAEGEYGDVDGNNDCRGDITGTVIRGNKISNVEWVGIIDWWAGGLVIEHNEIDCGERWSDGIILQCSGYCNDIVAQFNSVEGCQEGSLLFRGQLNPSTVISVEEAIGD